MRYRQRVERLPFVQIVGHFILECEGNRMKAPVFEEFDPASDCDCPGCLHWRSAARSSPSSLTISLGGHPAAHGARRALVLAAAAGTVIGGAHTVPAVASDHGPVRPGLPSSDEPPTPQGGSGPLHGPAGSPGSPRST